MLDSFVQAATNLPHKALVYASLLAMLVQTQEGVELAKDIIERLTQELEVRMVERREVEGSKNIMRVLAAAAHYGVLSVQTLGQLMLQLLDECWTGAAGKLKESEWDIVMEVVITGLPIVSQRLGKE